MARVWTKAFWRSRADAPEGDLADAAPSALLDESFDVSFDERDDVGRMPVVMLAPTVGADRGRAGADRVRRAVHRLQRPRRRRPAGPRGIHRRGAGSGLLRRGRCGAAMTRSSALRTFVLVWLTVVWIWLWGDISFANVAGGLAVAVLIVFTLPLPRVPVEGRLHPLSLLYLLAGVDVLRAGVQRAGGVAGDQAGPAAAHRRAAGAAGDQVRSGARAADNMINLIPGTVVLEIDQSRRTMLVHVLDVGTDHAVETVLPDRPTARGVVHRDLRTAFGVARGTRDTTMNTAWHQERETRP